MNEVTSSQRFLDLLDPDPLSAARKYNELRKKLTFYFRQRCARDPEDLADETITRVTRRLAEGASITTALPNYCYGVAALVLKEYYKGPAAPQRPDGRPPARAAVFRELSQPEQTILVGQCLEILGASDRAVVRHYYWGDRHQLARRLNVSSNALRIRVFRILESLRAKLAGEVK